MATGPGAERTALTAAADELYGSARSDFVARRTDLARRARTDGDATRAKTIGKLPKPTPGAWVVDALVRHRFDDVARLLDLGAQLREAQQALAGADLRALASRQHRAVTAVADAGRALGAAAGDDLSDATYQQVVQTLYAAMADPDAASAVASGRLIRHLASVGFDAVDLAGAVALPDSVVAYEPRPLAPVEVEPSVGARSKPRADSDSGARPAAVAPGSVLSEKRSGRHRGELADARQRVRNAERTVRASNDERTRAAQSLADSRQRVEDLDHRRAELQAELRVVEAELEEVRHFARDAKTRDAEAVRAVARADVDAERARTELRRLEA